MREKRDNQTAIRILIADDFRTWRAYAHTILQTGEELAVVGEASDGLEAVRKAAELNPDLILLDVSLPHLSGIEATEQILGLAPDTKIIFVTQNLDLETARLAFNKGARGYVVKADAERELVLAIRAVLQGRRFVSRTLALAQ